MSDVCVVKDRVKKEKLEGKRSLGEKKKFKEEGKIFHKTNC